SQEAAAILVEDGRHGQLAAVELVVAQLRPLLGDEHAQTAGDQWGKRCRHGSAACAAAYDRDVALHGAHASSRFSPLSSGCAVRVISRTLERIACQRRGLAR